MDATPQFKLQTFEGPLDLLMHLLRKNKISIIDIPVVEITEQYMAYLREMERFEIEISSEFLVMAAQLLFIKSRLLLPRQEEVREDEEDPREELIRRLQEHQRYREASSYLREREGADRWNFYRRPDPIERPPADYSDQLFDLDRLIEAFRVVLEKTERKAPPPPASFRGIVGHEKVSVSSRVRFLRRRLSGRGRVPFASLFSGMESRPALIATFLALLELMKLERIKVEEDGKDIYVRQNGEIEYELDR